MEKLLVIGLVYPEPESSAAGRRILEVLDFFLSMNYDITFGTTANKGEHSFNLVAYGIKVQPINLNDPSFDDFIRQLSPQIVLFDRFVTEEQFGWRVAKYCPDALRILDTEDLHFLRYARQRAIKKDNHLNNVDLISDLTKREIASIYRCDLTLIISEYEMEILKSTFNIPINLLVYYPFVSVLERDKLNSGWPCFKERNHFVSIGNFKHAPNKDAVIELKNKVWPVLRTELPGVELHIYGAYCDDQIKALSNPKENFLVKGRAHNVAAVMQKARAYLAPLRFGAGLKGKLLDAMENGLPGVTTSIGAEGMMLKNEWNGFIADELSDFIDAAVQLYTDENKWIKAVETGEKICLHKFGPSSIHNRFKQTLKTVLTNLNSHRRKNFTGALLMHHSMQSTRYLSKYIELKNQK